MILGLKIKSFILITFWSQVGAFISKVIDSDYWGLLWQDLKISGPSDAVKSIVFWITGMVFYWLYKKFNLERFFKPFKQS